jgi:hypothetical protein
MRDFSVVAGGVVALSPRLLHPCMSSSLTLTNPPPRCTPSLPRLYDNSQYHLNKMYQEALNTFTLIVKNKQYAGVG